MPLPTRRFGGTGTTPAVLGLGGEGVLRSYARDREAAALIRRALELGVSYFEAARAYAGCEEYLGATLGADRQHILLASKTHNRRARGVQAHLDESLALLRTDWLDVWYLHDLRHQDDLDQITGPGGALETVERAKRAGAVRFVGLSGHEDPHLLRKALDLFDFDCVLMPVNPAEAFVDSFAEVVLPEARARGMGVVAMKTLCRGLVARVSGFRGCAEYLHYALATPGVSLVSVGCDDTVQLEANVAAAQPLPAVPEEQREALEQQVYPYYRDLLYYRPPAVREPT